MKALIVMALRTMFSALVTKPMLFWGAKLAARQSDTLIDDKVVLVLENAFNSDIEGTRKALQDALEQVEAEYKKAP